ncbi:homocysteine S-methyltransferase family protein [Clostridium sp. MSJ-4]|uniref:Methionine synthase n=1 Tax=Clostridium simiarum TaxID=2841506 RepID=A0ABS6EZB1_9CLOT|nr:homocysteine S-methyltransferase family protein [Clostridium simiarum]
MELKRYLEKNFLIFDGAMGTILQSLGLKAGELPEILNIKEPEKVIEVHKRYINAGSKVITTNTFGANELKLKDTGFKVEAVISTAVSNAKEAIKNEEVFIALDIGPIGRLLEPMGDLSFERAYEIFKRQIIQGVRSGVDLILIETMTDLYEAKAAVLAAKENSNLPVFCTMSFQEDGRTFSGCTALAMTTVLQGLGVDALGVNCSLGPKEIEPIISEILKVSKIPVMVQANAGIPRICNGETTYDISPKEFALYSRKYLEKGVKIIGGCCGTNDEYIKSITKELNDIKIQKRETKDMSAVCTPTKVVLIEGIKVIGERINPTGKRLFKEALRNNDIDYILREAILQVEAGADILDINVGLPEIDEEKTMIKVIKEIQAILDVPLQIDSNDPKVIESALRIYNGKAIVNSVNGEDKVLDTILPIVKKYGAAVIGLTLDNKGIPSGAKERFKIAEKIVKRAEDYGIGKEDIYIDCLTLTAAAQQKEVEETLSAITLVKEKLNVRTVLGVSNVSFGLPNRRLLNRTFLSASLMAGLSLPIIDPMDKDMMDTVKASKVFRNDDVGSVEYIECYKDIINDKKQLEKEAVDDDLSSIILKGLKGEAKYATCSLLNDKKPLEIVNQYIVPALDLMGKRYEKGEIFLPQLIQSAETVKKSFDVIKEEIKEKSDLPICNGKIILATVKGDIHDIGKNIVKVLLESYGFEVLDLGKDVSKEIIIEEAIKNNIKLIGLSALMTTTVKSMEDTIKDLKSLNPQCKVMVGGAVLNKEYADMIGADYYAKDANESVEIAKEFFKERN